MGQEAGNTGFNPSPQLGCLNLMLGTNHERDVHGQRQASESIKEAAVAVF